MTKAKSPERLLYTYFGYTEESEPLLFKGRCRSTRHINRKNNIHGDTRSAQKYVNICAILLKEIFVITFLWLSYQAITFSMFISLCVCESVFTGILSVMLKPLIEILLKCVKEGFQMYLYFVEVIFINNNQMIP